METWTLGAIETELATASTQVSRESKRVHWARYKELLTVQFKHKDYYIVPSFYYSPFHFQGFCFRNVSEITHDAYHFSIWKQKKKIGNGPYLQKKKNTSGCSPWKGWQHWKFCIVFSVRPLRSIVNNIVHTFCTFKCSARNGVIIERTVSLSLQFCPERWSALLTPICLWVFHLIILSHSCIV